METSHLKINNAQMAKAFSSIAMIFQNPTIGKTVSTVASTIYSVGDRAITPPIS